MQTEAYRLTGFAVVISALGFLLRWLQDMQILDVETGLATPGAAISVVVTLLLILVAGVFAFTAITLKRRTTAPTAPQDALAGKTFLFKALSVLPAVLLIAAGAMILLSAWSDGEQTARRLSGAAAIAAGLGMILIASGVPRAEKAVSCRIGVCLLILFGGFWLIAEYKAVAADPVIWRFAVEILAICASLMAFYYIAGYFFGEPSSALTIFFCYLGGFLCVMSAVDDHTMAENVCFGAVAVQLFLWGYVLVSNLRRGAEEPLEPEAGSDTEAA